MDTEIKDLLAVLDMPKTRQKNWIYTEFSGYYHRYPATANLADLAFKLRDEVCKDSLTCGNYIKTLRIVYKSFCKSQEGTIRQNMVPYDYWLAVFIVPQERIIAALISKKLSKGSDNGKEKTT